VIPFELYFIYQNKGKFFSVESESRKINDQTTDTSNWTYSNLLDITIPPVKQKQMLSELIDYVTALPKDAIKSLGRDIQRCVCNTAACAYGLKSNFSNRSMSCATFVMHVLYQ